MKVIARASLAIVLAFAIGCGGTDVAPDSAAPALSAATPAEIISVMTLVNDRFMAKTPSPGASFAIGASSEPVSSNTWTRAVYFEGASALYQITNDSHLIDYAIAWGDSHDWTLNGGANTRIADDQCAGQTYLDLFARDPNDARIDAVQDNIAAMVGSESVSDWTWIDAIQMAMPVFARVGVLRGDERTLTAMNALYMYTRNTVGGRGLYDEQHHLWFRDDSFLPPYHEPNGEGCYWSRGNGWVYAGLARVLDALPLGDARRVAYEADFLAMTEALVPLRRADGFWNVSLRDDAHFGGKELTGTSLFVYGMAWGIRHGLLSPEIHAPIVRSSWNAMVTSAVHEDGVLGYVQGTAAQPSDGQPVTYDSTPNVDDFAVGCFLLAGSEVAKL